jgi:tetratricopeptide (TPR) repeat protein
MAIAEQLIYYLYPSEQNGFREFSGKKGKKNIELQLFELSLKNPDAAAQELMEALYGKANRSAYKSTQLRLTEKLLDYYFILTGSDITRPRDIFRDLAVGMHLIKRSAWRPAAHCLFRAEQVALERRQYELLETIYSYQTQYTDELGIDVNVLLIKVRMNRQRYESWSNLNMTFALIRKKHREAVNSGKPLKRDEVLAELKAAYHPTIEEANDPAFMHQYWSLIRKVALSIKSYKLFERVLSRVYRRLKSAKAFLPTDAEFELGFLYMLAHAQFRNARFEQSMHTLDQAVELSRSLELAPMKITRKLNSLRASILNGVGRVQEAIPLIEDMLKNKSKHDHDPEFLNMQLSLAAYQYNAREYKPAVRTLNSLLGDKPHLTKLMGTEWRFKLEMFELISYYDRGMVDESLTQMQRIRAYYKDFFRAEEYARVEIYLGFVERMIKDPQCVTTEAFRQDVKSAQLNLRNDEEDIQAIAFYCWLTSKMFNRDYYDVLLNAIGWKRDSGLETRDSGALVDGGILEGR